MADRTIPGRRYCDQCVAAFYLCLGYRKRAERIGGESFCNLSLRYPPVETNTVESHMKAQFGLQSTQVNSAQRQQGLLHLYKKWCTQGRCEGM